MKASVSASDLWWSQSVKRVTFGFRVYGKSGATSASTNGRNTSRGVMSVGGRQSGGISMTRAPRPVPPLRDQYVAWPPHARRRGRHNDWRSEHIREAAGLRDAGR